MIRGASLVRIDIRQTFMVLETYLSQKCGEIGAIRGQAFQIQNLKVLYFIVSSRIYRLNIFGNIFGITNFFFFLVLLM